MFDMLCVSLPFNVSTKRLYYSTRNRFYILNTTKIFSLVKHLDLFLINRGLDNRLVIMLNSYVLIVIYSSNYLIKFNKEDQNVKK